MTRAAGFGLAALVGATTLAVLAVGARPPRDADAPAPASARAQRVPSNVEREDYVGPQACRECHGEVWDAWWNHPHRRMNADVTEDGVVGNFSGVARDYGRVRTVFERDDGRFVMSYYRGDTLQRRDVVTRTIGSRLQQAYVGVQLSGPEPPGDPIYTTERALPWVWWFSRGQWYPEHFVEQYPEPEYTDAGELRYPLDDPYSRGTRPWAEGCMPCHNTYPYAERFADEMPGRGFVAARRVVAAPAAEPTPAGLVTLGVSCEACHFGGRDHAIEDRDPVAVPQGPTVHAWPEGEPARLRDPAVVVSICAQCHVAGTLPYPNGAASLNSSEALDLRRGDCASQISCLSCHDPHTGNPPGGGPDAPHHVAACVGCHADLAGEPARRAHARHDASEASCLDCHMARITQGIDTVVRSHRIDSPTNLDMLATASPNACNLCHLDRSIDWTLDALAEGWDVRIARGDDWADAYGDDSRRPMLQVWLEHPTPIVRLVAADALARRRSGPRAAAELVPLLLDEYPQNRMFGMFALERMLGRRLEDDAYTPTATIDVRTAQVEALARMLAEAG